MRILLTMMLFSCITCMAFSDKKKQNLQAFSISKITSKIKSEKPYLAEEIKIYTSNPKMILKDGVFVADRTNVQNVSIYGLTKIQALNFFKAVVSEVAKREVDKFLPIEFDFFEAENFKITNNTSQRVNENLYFTIIYKD